MGYFQSFVMYSSEKGQTKKTKHCGQCSSPTHPLWSLWTSSLKQTLRPSDRDLLWPHSSSSTTHPLWSLWMSSLKQTLTADCPITVIEKQVGLLVDQSFEASYTRQLNWAHSMTKQCTSSVKINFLIDQITIRNFQSDNDNEFLDWSVSKSGTCWWWSISKSGLRVQFLPLRTCKFFLERNQSTTSPTDRSGIRRHTAVFQMYLYTCMYKYWQNQMKPADGNICSSF